MIKKIFHSLLPLIGGVCLLIVSANAQQANNEIKQISICPSETISIATMQWPSAALLANIHAQIIEQEFGCKTKIVPGNLSATISSMATTGQPMIAPETWISRISKIYNLAIENQKIRKGGQAYTNTAFEGWYIPNFIAKNHPELKSISQLKDYLEVFSADGEKGRFISCPKDWACAIINRNMLKALGLYNNFEIIEPINRFEMDTFIGSAVSKHEPALFYYWQPNAILTQFNFLRLDMGDFNQEAFTCLAKKQCGNPIISSFAPEPVVSVLVESVFINSPQIATYFLKAQMPLEKMNEALAWQDEKNLSAKATASWFLEENEKLWKKWLVN